MDKKTENSDPVLKLTQLAKTLMECERELVAFSPEGATRVPKDKEADFASKLSELVETSVDIEKTALTFRNILLTRRSEIMGKRKPKGKSKRLPPEENPVTTIERLLPHLQARQRVILAIDPDKVSDMPDSERLHLRGSIAEFRAAATAIELAAGELRTIVEATEAYLSALTFRVKGQSIDT